MTSPRISPETPETGDYIQIFPAIKDSEMHYTLEYFKQLGINPIQTRRSLNRIHEIASAKYAPFPLSHLPDNSGVMGSPEIDTIIAEVRQLTDSIYRIDQKSPIRLMVDDCFTNTCLEKTLIAIYQDSFSEVVEKIIVDHENGYYPFSVPDPRNDQSISIFGGSYFDPYNAPSETFDIEKNPMAKLMIEGMLGKRFVLAICFSHQVASILYNKIEPKSPLIPATIRGAAQFGPTTCQILDLKLMDPLDREILAGLSNNGKNNHFSIMMTRTGHVVNIGTVHNNSGYGSLHPLVIDQMTPDEMLMWRMHGLVGIAGHPEITRDHRAATMIEVTKTITPFLEENYKCSPEDIWKQMVQFPTQVWKQDTNLAFYAPILRAFLRRLTGNDETLHFNSPLPLSEKNYNAITRRIIWSIRKRVQNIEQESDDVREPLFSKNHRFGLLSSLDRGRLTRKKYRLELNNRFDWKVNRGIEESSEILGINLFEFLQHQYDYLQEQKVIESCFFVRDWGAGNGHLIKDLDERNKIKGRLLQSESSFDGSIQKAIPDMITYGVGDQIYFDLYQGLEESHLIKSFIPPEASDVLILFVKKIIDEYHRNPSYQHMSLDIAIRQIVQTLSLAPNEKILRGSMFAKETRMFPNEMESEMSSEAKKFLVSPEGEMAIHQIKSLLVNDLYGFFSGHLERILLHDFQNYRPDDSILIKVHAQVSIRSTSHLSDTEYEQTLNNYIAYQTHPGSIFLDNGVHQSYTYIPRIRELKKLQEDHGKYVKISLIYDTATNYFCTAIIETPIMIDGELVYHNPSWWDPLIKNGKKLISIDEAANSQFFQIERWIRDYLMLCFRDNEIFYYFDADIIETLLKISEDFKKGIYDTPMNHIRDLMTIITQRITQNIHLEKYFNSLLMDTTVSVRDLKMNLRILRTYIHELDDERSDIHQLLRITEEQPIYENLETLVNGLKNTMGLHDFARFKDNTNIPPIQDILDTGLNIQTKLNTIIQAFKKSGSTEPPIFSIPATRNRRSTVSTLSSSQSPLRQEPKG